MSRNGDAKKGRRALPRRALAFFLARGARAREEAVDRLFRADLELSLISDEDHDNEFVSLAGASLLLSEGKPAWIALGVEAGLAAVGGLFFVGLFWHTGPG
jgi:hypothetical protein